MVFPEPESGLSEELFRKKWLSLPAKKNQKEYNDVLWHLGTTVSNLRVHNKSLRFSNEDQKIIETIIEGWIKCIEDPKGFSVYNSYNFDGIVGLQFILSEIKLSPNVAACLFSTVQSLNQTSTPGYRLFAGLVNAMPDRLDEFSTLMRIGLSSDNNVVAEQAAFGLSHWLQFSSNEKTQFLKPPIDIISEIGLIIATRRLSALNPALQTARWIFTEGDNEQREAIAPLTLRGLNYLIEELRYDRDHPANEDWDVPLLRWGCAHLAMALSACGYEKEPIVKQWRRRGPERPAT